MAVSATNVLQGVADRTKVNVIGNLAPYYASTVVPQALVAAQQEIQGRLLYRGFLAAQIAAWDRLDEFTLAIAIHLAMVNAGAYKGFDPETIKLLDRRTELDTVIVFAAGVVVNPQAGGPGVATCNVGTQNTTGDTFIYAGPESPDNTHF